MKITFKTSVTEGDVTRNGVTVEHLILYPDRQIVVNGVGGASRMLPLDGLSQAVTDALAAFLSALAGDIEGEFLTGAVTAKSASIAAKAAIDSAQIAAQATIRAQPVSPPHP